MATCATGVITSYDPQRRFGYIKQDGNSAVYYFGKVSIRDDTLHPKLNLPVRFNILKVPGKEPVAVEIHACNDVNNKKNTEDHVHAVVLNFNESRGYGFIRCETNPPVDAFLHKNELSKSGVNIVLPQQKIRVRLKSSGKRLMNAFDVLLVAKEDKSSVSPKTLAQQNLPNNACPTQSLSAKDYKHHWSSFDPHASNYKTSVNSNLSSITSAASVKTASRDDLKIHLTQNSIHLTQNKSNVSSDGVCNVKSDVEKQFQLNCGAVDHCSPEQRALLKVIDQKKKLLKTSNIKALPDGGKRIKDQIAALEKDLLSLSLNKPEKTCGIEKQDESSTCEQQGSSSETKLETSVADLTNTAQESSSNASFCNIKSKNLVWPEPQLGTRIEPRSTSKITLQVGRYLTYFLMIVIVLNQCSYETAYMQVTVEAVEKLHLSLKTCPLSYSELDDPKGLLVR